MLIRAAEGYCPCCDQSTVFVANNYWLRDYYRCIKCNSIPRNRAIMKVLHERFPSFKDLRVHESSPDITTISVLGVKIPNYSYSYYHDEFPLGADLENGGTNENLEQLTLPDNSVDVFITQDVMEHICNPRAAFQEIERVLCAGGVHVFTTPIYLFRKTQARGKFEQGKWVNLLPPVYHGNPISEKGSLVTYDWGDDIAQFIDSCTNNTHTEIIQFPQTKENYEMGLEADFLQVIVSQKEK